MRARNIATSLILHLAMAVPCVAQNARDKIAAMVEDLHSQGHFNGVVLVARGNETIYSNALGMADAEGGVANEIDTRFRIASVTKGFTAVLALQAVERGELDVQKSILEYLPDVKNDALAEVTVEHLLQHTSGIEDFAPARQDKSQSVREAVVEQLNRTPLASRPGENQKYCNVGYTILGFVLENATGQSYETLLDERIFEPLEMTSTYLEGSPEADYPVRAQGYTNAEGQLKAEELDDLSLFPAAGAIVSTAPNLLKFSEALRTDALLSEHSREVLRSGPNGATQYGCKNMRAPSGDRVQIFQGGMPGASSLLLRINDGEHTVVLLSNFSNVPSQQLALGILMALLQ